MNNYTTNSKQGFTLVEILVVGSIIALVSTVALSSLATRSPEYQVKNATWQLASDLRLARMQALSQNTNVEVKFDNANGKYTIWTDSNRDGAEGGNEVVTRSIAEFKGATLYGYPATATFTPQGTMDSGWLYMYIQIRNFDVSEYQIIYVFPNGHIDPQGYNS